MNNKKAFLAIAVLVMLLVIAALCWYAFKPTAVEGVKTITVEITHKDGSLNTYDLTTEAQYLYDALSENEIIGELKDGFFTELDGETADSALEEWWGYTKSGEYVNYGVADCVITDGDHYEFTFHVGWE